eukprot:TRINITY_DN2590_c0_g1_i5.p1 TRINITY_DN2590_c0_g1~~TRINITY_DN2590_c0_g1_i5.p1  ORF type:complete len:249 (-),score=62.91 TRINITY_DN2590_c0_g1_i5:20-766(-)
MAANNTATAPKEPSCHICHKPSVSPMTHYNNEAPCCKSCITEWVKKKGKCPMCSDKMSTSEIRAYAKPIDESGGIAGGKAVIEMAPNSDFRLLEPTKILKTTDQKWATCWSKGPPCTSGNVWKWVVTVDKIGGCSGIVVGVVEEGHEAVDMYLGKTAHSWGYSAVEAGLLDIKWGAYHDGNRAKYGRRGIATHTRVAVTLDLTPGRGTLAFAGTDDWGVAFSDGLAGKKLLPAVPFFFPDEGATFSHS